jgi:flagellar biosynthesis GTPase FlhF
MVVNFLDMCMNFGGIFNLATHTPKLPFKLFGTGEVVPEDIESATPERLLAGIFSLK